MSTTARSRSIRAVAIAAAVAVLAVIGALLVPSTASAAPGPISGVVHGPDGKPLAGVVIHAVDLYYDGTVAQEGTTTSTSTGTFSFDSLGDGSSTLWFAATAKTYAQYLGQTTIVSDAQGVFWNPGKQYYVQATLAASGTLAGKVTRIPSGNLAGYTVRAYRQQDSDGSWKLYSSTKSSSSGSYSLTGLEPGGYRLETVDLTSKHPAYAASYSGGATEFSAATTVGVIAGKTSTYNFALGKAGSISGTVTGVEPSAATENLANVQVSVYQLDGTPGSFTADTPLDSPSTVTASNGTYTVSGLAPGFYAVEFTPPSTAPYSPSGTQYGRAYLGGTDSPTTASYIQIGNGTAATGANEQLTAGATIEGTVVEASDGTTPLEGMRVSADYVGRDQDDPNERVKVAESDASGNFTITGLGPGTYDLWVGSHPGTDPNSDQENQAYIRQVIHVPGPLASGDDVHVDPEMTPIASGQIEYTVAPSIVQTTAVTGDTLTLNTGTWTASDVTFTYQWFRSGGGGAIVGATGSSYVLQPADVETYVYAEVDVHSFGSGSGSYQTNGIVPTNATMANPSVAPSISGVAAVGQALTADPGVWPISGTIFTFQWQFLEGATWIDMQDGNGPTVLLDGLDFNGGDHIRVIVTGQKQGYDDLQAAPVVDGDTEVETPIQLVTPPTPKKTAAGLTLVGGTWNPAAYDSADTDWDVWTPGGVDNQYTNTTTLPAADFTAADYITATMTHQYTGWTFASTGLITAQLGSAPVPTGSTLVIGGTVAQVGITLTAPAPNWVPATGTSTYQWQYKSGSAWKNIGTNGPNASYVPTATDGGRVLRVVTTRTDSGFATATLASSATVKVALAPESLVTSSTPGYTGTLGTGDTVTEALTWTPTPTSRTYQWEYSASNSGPFTKISKATGPSYTIPVSLVNDYLEIVETGSLPGHVNGQYSFAKQLGQITPDKLALVKAPTITHVGSQYSASGATFSPAIAPGLVEYHWSYYDENDATLTDASGDAGPTYSVGGPPSAHWVLNLVVQPINGYTYHSSTPIFVKAGDTVPGTLTLPASQVGQAIVPPVISWYVLNPTVKYQWQYESGTTWHSIAASTGGTASTYAPISTYYNHNVRVIETASRTNYTTASVTSSPTLVGLGDAPTPGLSPDDPGLNGYGVGGVWTVVPGTWSVPGVTFSYDWQFSPTGSTPWTDILGQTKSTYTAPDDLYHEFLRVVITATKTGYAPGSTTVQSPKLQAGTMHLTTEPKVTLSAGTYTVTNNGTWSPAPTSYEYDWEVIDPSNDNSTQVSTTDSYTPQLSDADKLITLQMYPDRTGWNSSGAFVIVQPGPAISPTSAITLTGTPLLNGTLTINVPGWSTIAPFVQVTWYRNGVATGTNINSLTYTPVAADLGKTITAKLVASKSGYATANASLTSSGPVFSDVVPSASVDPAISGTDQVGDVLTASTGTWNVAGLAFAYQWYRHGVAIPGANSASYQLIGADDRQEITVQVTASKPFFSTVSDLSQAVTVNTNAYLQNSLPNPITITGSHAADSTVTASIGGTWNVPVTYTYQWYVSHDGGSNYLQLYGQGARTLALTMANGIASGDWVEVAVTATAPGYGGAYPSSSLKVTP